MDYAKPADVVASMIDASLKKLALTPRDLLIRGALSGALLGAATSLAFGAAVTTGQPLVGALVFPVGFVMIVLLGLELVTGSFASAAARAPGRQVDSGAPSRRELVVGVSRKSARQHDLAIRRVQQTT